MERVRCDWAGEGLMQTYHDSEWGVPLHDDRRLFELLVLEGAQAGLSWAQILARRDAYRKAFDDFDIGTVARYGDRKLAELVGDAGIVRNRQKIQAAALNARAVLQVQSEVGSLDGYLWSFVGGNPRQNAWSAMGQVPPVTAESERMSAELRKRGFKFVGATICYAFMQSAGMVNDHLTSCFRYPEVQAMS